MRLVLVRHGATEWSVAGKHTGRTDIPLTADGIAQAGRAAAGLNVLLDALQDVPVFCSPLLRARVTAEIMFANTRFRLDDDLKEFHYGDYEGLTSAEIHAAAPGWDIWRDGCPNGETTTEVGARCDRFLARAEHAGDTVAVVAHGHLLRILTARAVGLAAEQGRIFTLDTATISVIEDVRGARVVRLWNVDPALLGPRYA